VAVVDDDRANQERELRHVRIYGTIAETGYIIQKLERKQRKPQRIILTRDTFPKDVIEGLLSAAEETHVSLAHMPRISALDSGDPARCKYSR